MGTSYQLYKLIYGQTRKETQFKNLGVRSHSFEDVITNPKKYLSGDRENIFVTLAECHEEPVSNQRGKSVDRYMAKQEHICFDIDNIDQDKIMETLAVVRVALGLNSDQGYAICSGNGLQLFIKLKDPFDSVNFFAENRKHYKALCSYINTRLEEAKLPGDADASVFKNTQVVRVPNTINKKPGKEAKQARYLNGTFDPVDFKLELRAPEKKEESIDKASYDKLKMCVDNESVLKGCEFLKYAKKEAKNLPEPEWYVALGILAFMSKGDVLAHEYSRLHPDYDYDETEAKIRQVRDNQTGPRTCESVEAIWGGCSGCENYQKCKTPLHIKGPNFIESAGRGFRKLKYKAVENPDGTTTHIPAGTGQVDYDDFLKYFRREFHYRAVSVGKGKLLYTYNKTHWEHQPFNFISYIAQKVIKNGTPKRSEKSECESIVKDSSHVKEEWLTDNSSTKQLVNFQNGVLDLRDLSLKNHDPKYPFFNVFPYSFKKAECPRTDEVLENILSDDPEAIEFFWRYLGSCFDPYGEIQKSLFVIGAPATGKSTIACIFDTVFPKETRTSLKLNEICNDNLFKFRAHQLYKKYVNIGDEGVPDHHLDMSNFKNAVSCGDITHERKGEDSFTFKCMTKFVVLANNYVRMKDASKDFARKFEVLATNKVIPPNEQDKRYQDLWIPAEREGIAYKAISKYREMLEEYEEKGFFDLKVTDNMLSAKGVALDATGDGDEFFDRIKKTGDEEDKVSIAELYSAYKDHCMANGAHVKYTRRQFVSRIRTRYATQLNLSWDNSYRVYKDKDNKPTRGIVGVKLLDEDLLKSEEIDAEEY